MNIPSGDLPPGSEYGQWEIDLAGRYPLSLSEMRSPSAARDRSGGQAIARWGIECNPGWRSIVVALLDRLETEIEAQPLDARDDYRVIQIKEKSGRLAVALATKPTSAMQMAIDEAGEQSLRVCELCGEPGNFTARCTLWSVRCETHEDWLPWNRPPG